MYQDFYKLKADPFRLSPDHAFCFRYPSFTKAKAYMRYALNAAEGFVMVTGRPGMGKTTLIDDLMSSFANSGYRTATLVNTQLEATELLRMVAYDFGLPAQDLDKATLLRKLKQYFVQARHAGSLPLLVVDEAQNLSLEALEELRLMTNLQFENRPLLQIFLIGQEGLRDKLQDPRLEQLRQRVTAACHLDPLTLEQTTAYIIHRLRVVGWSGTPELKTAVFPLIHEICEGVPRRINQFCSRLLLHGSLEARLELTPNDGRVVIEELDEEHLGPAPSSHCLLPGIATPTTMAEGMASTATDTLLGAAEKLLSQQEKADTHPAPVTVGPPEPPLLSPTPSETRDSARDKGIPPPRAGRRRPASVSTRRSGKEIGEPAASDSIAAASSRWPVFAYSVLGLLFAAASLFFLPSRYFSEWLSGRLSSLLESPAFSRADARVLPFGPTTDAPAPLLHPVKPKRREAQRNLADTAENLPPPVHSRADAPPVIPRRRPTLVATYPSPARTDPGTRLHQANLAHPDLSLQPIREAGHRPRPETRATLPNAVPPPAPTGTGGKSGSAEAIPYFSGTHTGEPPANALPVDGKLRLQAVARPPGQDVEGVGKRRQSVLVPETKARNTPSGVPPAVTRQVSFRFDSAEIRSQDRRLLDDVAATLKRSDHWIAHIVGYADNTGPKKYNQHLSRLRAKAVAEYLSRQGISIDRLRIEGKGSRELETALQRNPSQKRSARLVQIVLEPVANPGPATAASATRSTASRSQGYRSESQPIVR